MKKKINVARIFEKIRNNIIREGDIVICIEGKRGMGMSSFAIDFEKYVK